MSFNVMCLFEEARRLEQEGEFLSLLALVRHMVISCAIAAGFQPVEMARSLLPLANETSVLAFALAHYLEGGDVAPLTRGMYQVSIGTVVDAATAHLVVEQVTKAVAELDCAPRELVFDGLCGETESPVARVAGSIAGPVFQRLSEEERDAVRKRLRRDVEVDSEHLVVHSFEPCFHE